MSTPYRSDIQRCPDFVDFSFLFYSAGENHYDITCIWYGNTDDAEDYVAEVFQVVVQNVAKNIMNVYLVNSDRERVPLFVHHIDDQKLHNVVLDSLESGYSEIEKEQLKHELIIDGYKTTIISYLTRCPYVIAASLVRDYNDRVDAIRQSVSREIAERELDAVKNLH